MQHAVPHCYLFLTSLSCAYSFSYGSPVPLGFEFIGNPPAVKPAPNTTVTARSKGRSLLQVTTDSVSFSVVIATNDINNTQAAMLKANLTVEGFASASPPVDIPASCPANSISPEGSTSVTQCTCLPGYEGNASTGNNCIPCPIDTFCANGKLSLCPAHANAPALSDSIMDCACTAGFYGNGSVSCTSCPSNSFCTGGFAIDNCVKNAVSPTQSTGNTSCYCDSGFYGVNNDPCILCNAGSWCWMGIKNSCPANSSSKPGSSGISECISLEIFLNTPGVQTMTATTPLKKPASALDESTPMNQNINSLIQDQTTEINSKITTSIHNHRITETQAIRISSSPNITASALDHSTNATQSITELIFPTITALISDEQANDTQTVTSNPHQTTNKIKQATESLSPTVTALVQDQSTNEIKPSTEVINPNITASPLENAPQTTAAFISPTVSDEQANDTQTVTPKPDQTTNEIKQVTTSLSPTVTALVQDQSTNEIKPSTEVINPNITASPLENAPQTTAAFISPTVSDEQANDTQTVTPKPDQTTNEIKQVTTSLSPTVTALVQDQSTHGTIHSTVIINPSITASPLDHRPQTTTVFISPTISDRITTRIQRISTSYNPSIIQKTLDSTTSNKLFPSAGDTRMKSTSNTWQMKKTTTKRDYLNVTTELHTTNASIIHQIRYAKQEGQKTSPNNWPVLFSFLVVCMCVFIFLIFIEQTIFHLSSKSQVDRNYHQL